MFSCFFSSVLKAQPCSGAPAENTVTAMPAWLCPGTSVTLGLVNTYTQTGIHYRWYYSHISPFGPFTQTNTGQVPTVVTEPLITTIWYYVVVTCTNSAQTTTLSVRYLDTLSTKITATSAPVCAGAPVSLNATASGTIHWYASPTATNSIAAGSTYTAPPLTAGIYTYYAQALNSCSLNSSRIPVTLTVNPSPTITANSGSFCSGTSFTIMPSGAITYTITGGDLVVSPPTNTSYSISGTNSLGCVSLNTAVASVSVIASPSITVNSGSVCSGQPFIFYPTGADTYTVSGGSLSVTPLSTTIYSVSGTNTLGGCVSVTSATVNVAVTPTVSVNSGSICAGNSFTISPSGAAVYTITGGTSIVSPVTNSVYLVYGASNEGCLSSNPVSSSVTVAPLPTVSVSDATICSGKSHTILPSGAGSYYFSGGSAVVAPLTNTFYTVTGISSAGCVSVDTATVNVTVNVSPSITVNSGSICMGQSFILIPSDPALTYTYSGGSGTVNPSATTSYTVSGTDGFNCVSNAAVSTVSVIASPTISVNSGSICAGQIFTIHPAGAAFYTVTGGAFTVSPATNSLYLISGMSPEGCASINTITSTLMVVPLPTISVTGSATICTGQSHTISPSGAGSYSYSGGSAVVSPVTNTVYTVTGTSPAGCPAYNTLTVTLHVNPSPTITVNSGSICAGQSFSIVPSDPTLSYTYSGGTALVSPGTSTFYTLRGSNGFHCVSNQVVSNVTVNANPTISVNSGSICAGDVFTINPAGASHYTITGGSSTVSPVTNSFYVVTGKSLAGCAAVNTVTSSLTVVPLPTISAAAVATICSGQSYTIVPSGADSYSYSGSSPIVSPLNNTAYTVTGVSSVGCAASNILTVSLIVNPTPTITVNSGYICMGKTFTIVPSDPALHYTVSAGGMLVSPVTNTFYTLSGSNLFGCVSNLAVSQVTVYPNPTLSVNSGSICEGDIFTIVPSNSALNYTIAGNSSTVSPPGTTNYAVYGSDGFGCISNTAVSTVTVYTRPVVSVNSASICSGAVFTINPAGASSYSISGGSATVSPSSSTSYSVWGLSIEGCRSSAAVVSSVTVIALPNLTVVSGSVCSGSVFTITASGAATYSYSSGSATVSPSNTGTYLVTGTDMSGCQASGTSTVTVYHLPPVGANATSTNICAGWPVTLYGSGAQTYIWSDGIMDNTVFYPQSGHVYTVTGTDANNCSKSETVAVHIMPSPAVSVTASADTLCQGEPLIITAGGADFYSWSTGDHGDTLKLFASLTIYTVTGSLANGCSQEASVSVFINECTGIADIKNAMLLSVYPNPNNGHFFVKAGGNTENLTIEVVNTIGQRVYHEKLFTTISEVYMENCSKGIYFVSIYHGKKRLGVQKMLVVD
jgi:hypothetical protein